MPETEVRFFRDEDGYVPVLNWLDALATTDRRAFLKCRELLERLAIFGHELRRPTADHLEDGIYELRARVGTVNYRILYFFHGRHVALLAHGLTKERAIPKKTLKLAKARKAAFEKAPGKHTYEE